MGEVNACDAAPNYAAGPEGSGILPLLSKSHCADLSFWRTWYLGYIPSQRETVARGRIYDATLACVFDGQINMKQE